MTHIDTSQLLNPLFGNAAALEQLEFLIRPVLPRLRRILINVKSY